MTDATVDFGGVGSSGFDDSFHWIERGFHRGVVWCGVVWCGVARATERNLLGELRLRNTKRNFCELFFPGGFCDGFTGILPQTALVGIG